MAHRSPSHPRSNHLRLVALVHTGRFLSLCVTFGFAVLAIVIDNPEWLAVSGAAFFLWSVLALIHLAEAPRTRCAVCTAPLLDRTTCAKHREARKTLGGYRLNTALQILGTTHYDCQHCGEHVFCGFGEQPTPTRKRREEHRPSGTPIAELPARRDEIRLQKLQAPLPSRDRL